MKLQWKKVLLTILFLIPGASDLLAAAEAPDSAKDPQFDDGEDEEIWKRGGTPTTL